jgi:threonine aldolase
LADGLASSEASEFLYPVEANEVFVRLPENTLASLEASASDPELSMSQQEPERRYLTRRLAELQRK